MHFLCTMVVNLLLKLTACNSAMNWEPCVLLGKTDYIGHWHHHHSKFILKTHFSCSRLISVCMMTIPDYTERLSFRFFYPFFHLSFAFPFCPVVINIFLFIHNIRIQQLDIQGQHKTFCNFTWSQWHHSEIFWTPSPKAIETEQRIT